MKKFVYAIFLLCIFGLIFYEYQNYKILREQQRQHDAEIIKEVFQKHDQRVANCDERYYHWCLSQSMIQLGKELKQASPN
mgnify:CR=1 FL=1